MEGFPSSVHGRVLFIDKDNLNTDGIYGSKHTYRDDMTPEAMAAVTFENYDPNFNTLYQKGDVVVGGLNFGSGSSREQAATALKFKGIPCVIAGSFPKPTSATHSITGSSSSNAQSWSRTCAIR